MSRIASPAKTLRCGLHHPRTITAALTGLETDTQPHPTLTLTRNATPEIQGWLLNVPVVVKLISPTYYTYSYVVTAVFYVFAVCVLIGQT